MTYSEHVITALKKDGRSKTWLSDKLEITTVSLYRKVKNDSFTVSERFYISHLLNL